MMTTAPDNVAIITEVPASGPSTGSMRAVAMFGLFPEVTWDRWSGDLDSDASFFGWIARDDGRSDYVMVMLDEDGPWLISTSSARYSAEFSARLGFHNHSDCKRIEHDFPGVKATHSEASNIGGEK